MKYRRYLNKLNEDDCKYLILCTAVDIAGFDISVIENHPAFYEWLDKEWIEDTELSEPPK